MPPCVVADSKGRVPLDIKIFTFHGRALLGLVVQDRYGRNTSKLLLDTQGRVVPGGFESSYANVILYCSGRVRPLRWLTTPGRFAQIVRFAEQLARAVAHRHHQV